LPNPTYTPKYPRLDRRVVRAVRAFLDAKPYRAAHGEKVQAVNDLAAAVATAYRMPAPRVTIEPHAVPAGGLGRYDSTCNTVILPKFSLAATLYQMAVLKGLNDAKAKAWAASAIYLASPKTLRNMVRKGTVKWKVAKPAVTRTRTRA
jgi:hypothetical protein